MAFVTKSGSRFNVRQGNNFRLLSSFASRDKAIKERDLLHRTHNPKRINRAAAARKKFTRHKRTR